MCFARVVCKTLVLFTVMCARERCFEGMGCLSAHYNPRNTASGVLSWDSECIPQE